MSGQEQPTEANQKLNGVAVAVSDQVNITLGPKIEELKTLITNLTIASNLLVSRVAALESAVGEEVGGKRETRKAAADAKKAPAKVAADGTAEAPKLSNCLLFFKHALVTDYLNYRANYATPEVVATLAGIKAVEASDPKAYWNQVGIALWKTLPETTKALVKTDFGNYQTASTRAAEPDQLETATA